MMLGMKGEFDILTKEEQEKRDDLDQLRSEFQKKARDSIFLRMPEKIILIHSIIEVQFETILFFEFFIFIFQYYKMK